MIFIYNHIIIMYCLYWTIVVIYIFVYPHQDISYL